MNHSQKVREARALITKEENWTIGMPAGQRISHALNPVRVRVMDERANCFCLEGAVCRALGENKYDHGVIPEPIIAAIHEEACRLLAKKDVVEWAGSLGGLTYAVRLAERRVEDPPTSTPYLVNDDLGHAAALDLLDRAAARLERAEVGRAA